MTTKIYYEHYKGNIYEVLNIAKHTELEENLVIYKDMNGNVWARPEKMFFENVIIDGKEVPRFKKIKWR